MEPDPSPTRRWSPPTGLIVGGWLLTAAAVLWWLAATDSTDRLFIGVLIIALAAVSACAGLFRPRLAADTGGITVRGLNGTGNWAWHHVRVRLQRSQRLGRTVEVLELEVPEQDRPGGLIVLTKLDLGQDVAEVAEALEEIRSGNR